MNNLGVQSTSRTFHFIVYNVKRVINNVRQDDIICLITYIGKWSQNNSLGELFGQNGPAFVKRHRFSAYKGSHSADHLLVGSLRSHFGCTFFQCIIFHQLIYSSVFR